jgi:hypothetical protein
VVSLIKDARSVQFNASQKSEARDDSAHAAPEVSKARQSSVKRDKLLGPVLLALNEMIDVSASRTIALHTHLPSLILGLLVAVALLSGLLAGYAMAKRKSRSWLHSFLYALVVALAVYAVLDLDFPRSGLIRLDAADNALTELRNSIR